MIVIRDALKPLLLVSMVTNDGHIDHVTPSSIAGFDSTKIQRKAIRNRIVNPYHSNVRHHLGYDIFTLIMSYFWILVMTEI
jgi:hypothetical protein